MERSSRTCSPRERGVEEASDRGTVSATDRVRAVGLLRSVAAPSGAGAAARRLGGSVLAALVVAGCTVADAGGQAAREAAHPRSPSPSPSPSVDPPVRTADAEPAERGRLLFERRGCAVCHSRDASRLRGPSVLGMWGAELEDDSGSRLVVDRATLERSLFDPAAFVVAGYPAMMPSFRGAFLAGDVDDVAAYLASLAGQAAR